MGDISEMRALIVLAGFMLIFAMLVVMIQVETPSIVSGSPSITNPNAEDTIIDGSQVLAWNETATVNMTAVQDSTIGGHTLRFEGSNYPYKFISSHTFDQWWVFRWNINYFEWYRNGILVSQEVAAGMPVITLTQITADYQAYNMSGLEYEIRNSICSTILSISWNTTAYANATAAFDAGQLHLAVNINFSERNTGLNAWNIIYTLLTFDIHGIPDYIRAIILFGVWGAIAYLTFIFALRIAGALFGGGGA